MIADLDTPDSLALGALLHRSHHSRVYRASWTGGDVVVKKAIVRREENIRAFEDEVRMLSLDELQGKWRRAPGSITQRRRRGSRRQAPRRGIILPLQLPRAAPTP